MSIARSSRMVTISRAQRLPVNLKWPDSRGSVWLLSTEDSSHFLYAFKYAFSTTIEPGLFVSNFLSIRRKSITNLSPGAESNQVVHLVWIDRQVVEFLSTRTVADIVPLRRHERHLDTAARRALAS